MEIKDAIFEVTGRELNTPNSTLLLHSLVASMPPSESMRNLETQEVFKFTLCKVWQVRCRDVTSTV